MVYLLFNEICHLFAIPKHMYLLSRLLNATSTILIISKTKTHFEIIFPQCPIQLSVTDIYIHALKLHENCMNDEIRRFHDMQLK